MRKLATVCALALLLGLGTFAAMASPNTNKTLGDACSPDGKYPGQGAEMRKNCKVLVISRLLDKIPSRYAEWEVGLFIGYSYILDGDDDAPEATAKQKEAFKSAPSREIYWERMKANFTATLKVAPNWTRGLEGAGKASYNAGHYQEALPYFTKLADAKPTWRAWLGATQINLHDLDNAQKNLLAVLESNADTKVVNLAAVGLRRVVLDYTQEFQALKKAKKPLLAPLCKAREAAAALLEKSPAYVEIPKYLKGLAEDAKPACEAFAQGRPDAEELIPYWLLH